MWPYLQMWFPLFTVTLGIAICFGVVAGEGSSVSLAGASLFILRRLSWRFRRCCPV
jgi:hypothetical protein